MSEIRYIGKICSTTADEDFGVVSIKSVTREDGSLHGLETDKDIYVNKVHCDIELKVGMNILFRIDFFLKKSENKYFAIDVVEFVEAELIPKYGQPIPGFGVVVSSVKNDSDLALRRNKSFHANMKTVPQETISQVVVNEPMSEIPRDIKTTDKEEDKRELVRVFLSHLFPHMESFSADFRILDHTDDELDKVVAETVEGYKQIGLTQQVDVLLAEVKRFKEMRGGLALIVEDDLVRSDTVIPMRFLPDLFMAVPVWYFWTDGNDRNQVEQDWDSDDPFPHETVKHFCDLFSNQRWFDTFQLFNRRVRTLNQYKGEMIPPAVMRRMRKAVELFDFVLIATPYHDEAGKEWESIDWLRAIDPYVLGFKKGIPFFFVLARFSDTGTFPLFNELIADTVEFLRTNKEKLSGFNEIGRPYWYHVDKSKEYGQDPFGDYLVEHVDDLLESFENGNMFSWLRQEELSKT